MFSNQLDWTASNRSCNPFLSAFDLAVRSASADMSLPMPDASGHSLKSARHIAPVPVPMSRIWIWPCGLCKVAQIGKHRIDEDFRIRPRFQRLGRKRQRQAVELPLAENAMHRLMRQPPLDRRENRFGAWLSDRPRPRASASRSSTGREDRQQAPRIGRRVDDPASVKRRRASASIWETVGDLFPALVHRDCSPSCASWLA
jgi:hypothetical protein